VQFFMFCKRNITYNVLHVLLHWANFKPNTSRSLSL
jgi:hypothetical protein